MNYHINYYLNIIIDNYFLSDDDNNMMDYYIKKIFI